MLRIGVTLAPRSCSPRSHRISLLPVIGVGEYDILRDEVEAYAKHLADAGVDVAYHRAEGLMHGFFGMRLASAAAAEAVDNLIADLRSAPAPHVELATRGPTPASLMGRNTSTNRLQPHTGRAPGYEAWADREGDRRERRP